MNAYAPEMLILKIEREFENDNNAPLTAMPLSLFPIYLSLRYVVSHDNVPEDPVQSCGLLRRQCSYAPGNIVEKMSQFSRVNCSDQAITDSLFN